jgi:hypothetical protein
VSVHILFRRVEQTRRIFDLCPTCKRKTRKWGELEAYFGWFVTCTVCGEAWQDGEMLPRPFERGWRARQAEWARRLYAASLQRRG